MIELTLQPQPPTAAVSTGLNPKPETAPKTPTAAVSMWSNPKPETAVSGEVPSPPSIVTPLGRREAAPAKARHSTIQAHHLSDQGSHPFSRVVLKNPSSLHAPGGVVCFPRSVFGVGGAVSSHPEVVPIEYSPKLRTGVLGSRIRPEVCVPRRDYRSRGGYVSPGGPVCPEAGLFVPRRAYLSRGGPIGPEAGLCKKEAGPSVPRRASRSLGGLVYPEVELMVPRRACVKKRRAYPSRGGPCPSRGGPFGPEAGLSEKKAGRCS